MISVLEGPDLSGKSTAARTLMASGPNRELLRQGPPKHNGSILEQYLGPINARVSTLNTTSVELVLDRWHMGELVYGPILRGKSLLTGQQADYIDMVLQTFGTYFYYVTAPLNILEDRYDIRGDGLIKRDQLAEIWFNYDQILQRRPHWVMCTPSIPGGILPRTMPRMSPPNAGRYIGPVQPKVLLLGDQRNDQRFIFPFVPERASSGHWLMGAMHFADVNHMQVGLMNACEMAPVALFTQWWQLGRPTVISLGNNAWAQWKKAHGDPDSVGFRINHPQFERRFNYTGMETYGRMIKEAMDG